MHTNIEDRRATTPPGRRRTARVMVLATLMAILGAACAPPSPPADGGGGNFDFGPLTIPLPPIEIQAPATNIPLLGLCTVRYQPPGVLVRNATVTIPGIKIDGSSPIVTVPNVTVKIPNLRLRAADVTLSCLGIISVPVQIDVIIPSTVLVRAATLNLEQRTITLQNPSFTLNGAGLGVNGLDLVIPLPPIVNIPLPTAAIAF